MVFTNEVMSMMSYLSAEKEVSMEALNPESNPVCREGVHPIGY